MTDITLLKNFLTGLGLSPAEIETLRKDEGSLCINCRERSTRNWAVFEPCEHQVCFTCLDKLYDNYVLTDLDTMFVCPFCDTKVKDYSTKTK